MRVWLWSVASIVLFLIISYAALTWLLPLVLPFVLATVVAELLAPLADMLSRARRLRIPRGLASALLVLIMAALMGMLITAGVGRLVREVQGIARDLPGHYTAMQGLVNRWVAQFGAISQTLPESVQTVVHNALTSLQTSALEVLREAPTHLTALMGLPSLLADLLIFIIATFFILRDRRAFGSFLIGLLPEQWHGGLRQAKSDVWSSAMGIAKAVLFLVMISGLITMIGLSIIGTPYAVTMGLVVAVADILPVLGPGAVYIPWAIYHLATGNPLFGVKLLVLYGVVTAVRQVLEPRLVGQQAGLHPLTTLFSMYMGFQFFGALGVAFGPLLAILLKSLIQSGLLPVIQAGKPRAG